jgi:hypothetical protein
MVRPPLVYTEERAGGISSYGFRPASLVEAQSQPAGFAVDGVAMLETDAAYAGYSPSQARNIYEELRQRIASIPGVQLAVLAKGDPMSPVGLPVVMEGSDVDGQGRPAGAIWAGPGYFDLLQIPVLYGRAIDNRDLPETPRVAVITESMARQYFGAVNAVGRRFRIQLDSTPSWIEVVGVVRDTGTADRTGDLVDPIPYLFFRSFVQWGFPPTTVLARTSLDSVALTGAMQRESRAFNSSLPILSVKTMEQHLENSLTAPQTATTFLGTLGVLGACLAGIGLHAVVAFVVSRRSREIGIRMALGAKSRQVVWSVAREVAILMAAGTGLGLALSMFVVFALRNAGLPASTLHFSNAIGAYPAALLLIAGFMAIIGLAAAYVPARRAVRIDPLVALRQD